MVILIMDLITARIHIILLGLQFEAGLLKNVFIIALLLPLLKLNEYVLCMFT